MPEPLHDGLKDFIDSNIWNVNGTLTMGDMHEIYDRVMADAPHLRRAAELITGITPDEHQESRQQARCHEPSRDEGSRPTQHAQGGSGAATRNRGE